MNPLNINHIKIENANAIKLKYQKLRKFTSIFRIFEIFLLFAVISRLFFQLPLALTLVFRLFCEHVQYLSLLLVSPQFVFIIGNAIVITLFLNSGHFSTQHQVKLPKCPPPPLPKKQGIITEENTMMASIFSAPLPDHHHHHQHKEVVKVYRRSKSERPRREKNEAGCSSLQRSNTEIIKSLKVKEGCCEEAKEGHYPEDHMSNEEFRKTIEDFIAKQQRFLKEEEEFSAIETNFEL